jgi:hypothetical protein
MNNLSVQNLDSPRPELTQISEEERCIINDIRRMVHGRITVFIQDGNIISKEVTTTTKNFRKKNGNGSGNSYYAKQQDDFHGNLI